MKTAVVTGTSYGLGKAIAEALLRDGFRVYGVSRTKSPISDENFIWVKADLLESRDIEKIKDLVKESKLDVLVNNAGTHIAELALSISEKTFNHLFGLNFLAPALLTKSLSKKLNGGMVVNISSTSDRLVDRGDGLYSATKAAMEIFFDALVIENKDIKIIQVLPSYIDTPLQHKINNDPNFDWEECAKPEDIAVWIRDLLDGRYKLESGEKVMVLNNKTMGDTEDPEKLWYYNVDTKEFKKIK